MKVSWESETSECKLRYDAEEGRFVRDWKSEASKYKLLFEEDGRLFYGHISPGDDEIFQVRFGSDPTMYWTGQGPGGWSRWIALERGLGFELIDHRYVRTGT